MPLEPFDIAYPELVMIVEGKARGVEDSANVRVIDSPGEGDDTIVDTVRELAGTGHRLLRRDRGPRAAAPLRGRRCDRARPEVATQPPVTPAEFR